ncbi:hypothetical protein GGS26DRAFT_312136 [Hypomontagnella submonticulosa]|nr:hypothetical protein GGS26DRAFT_312136 [Hypomontagnella submonticulosa]
MIYDDQGKVEVQLTAMESSAPKRVNPRDPTAYQGYLLTLSQDKLPKLMGSKYAEVVKTCLTCLDEDNKDFEDESEFMDEDGIVVRVRYIEKVRLYTGTVPMNFRGI